MELEQGPVQSVSVVIPTYNYGRFLGRAITSILEQTLPVLEIIVVDDGSTDNTREVAQSFGDRIRYVYHENRGLCASRNAGIQLAQGEWIGFLDADDWWLPEKHAKVQALLREHPEAVLIYHPHTLISDKGPQGIRQAADPDGLWPAMLYDNWISGGSSALLRTSVVRELGGFDESLNAVGDWDMWARVALRHPVHRIPETLSMVWVHEQNMSGNGARMADESRRLVGKTLALGVPGFSRRLLYRQRTMARFAYEASVELRSRDRAASHRFLIQSFKDWPSPIYLPKRSWAACLAIAGRV
jgi:glycosyltransferase involved in cell wall biosynthesis